MMQISIMSGLLMFLKLQQQNNVKHPWIGENGASLEDFLDPLDDSLTIEGYPAPTRAIVVCDR